MWLPRGDFLDSRRPLARIHLLRVMLTRLAAWQASAEERIGGRGSHDRQCTRTDNLHREVISVNALAWAPAFLYLVELTL